MQKLTGQYENHFQNQDCLAAFFDVDHTLIQGDTQALEARHFMANDRLSSQYIRNIALVLAALALYRTGRISLARQNEIYLKIYKGRTETNLAETGRGLYNRVVSRLFFPGVLALLEAHRSKGDLIVLVSASTRHLLAPLLPVLKPDHLFCTDLEFDGNGRATGRAIDGICAQEKKPAVVRAFAAEHGVDLRASFAYSDHHSDISFLSSVGQPAVVNPTPKMAAHARKMGWPVNPFD